MPDPIDVVPGVRIPAAALEARGVRSGGPGGQNVNKVASKAELFVDLALVEGLDDGARARLLALAEGRRDADGFLRLTAGESRDFHRNLERAREKARALVAKALVVPRKRRATRPTAGAREARLALKKRLAKLKRNRARPRGED
ncbi:MAG TPA: alternative ribosome rescue aminoacyl-tRNA hydrolase ArfB [Thermoanaerobaculia bacterium]|nr:alternative ribosome rescue aminoacyl-tRNA hydrolase ArfB [Thermoanaerobaculia bacterium]